MEEKKKEDTSTGQMGCIGWFKSRTGLAFIGFAVIAAFFLWEEHKAHILGILPYVLLLLCPLLHLFMHRRHGGGSEAHDQSDRDKE